MARHGCTRVTRSMTFTRSSIDWLLEAGTSKVRLAARTSAPPTSPASACRHSSCRPASIARPWAAVWRLAETHATRIRAHGHRRHPRGSPRWTRPARPVTFRRYPDDTRSGASAGARVETSGQLWHRARGGCPAPSPAYHGPCWAGISAAPTSPQSPRPRPSPRARGSGGQAGCVDVTPCAKTAKTPKV